MRDYVLTAFVAVLVPICIARPWIGILGWYWLGLMNPHRLTWSFAYTMPFAMIIGGATLLGAVFARDRKPIAWSAEMVLMATLLGWFTLTTFFAWAPADAWPQWEKVTKIVFMTFVATMFIYGRDRIRALFLVVGVSIGFYGVKGGIWSILNGGAEKVLGPDGSFISGNTFIGLALNMVIPLIVAIAREEERRWLRVALYATAMLSGVASIFTYSRGAWLGLMIVAPLVLLQFGWRLRVALAVVGLVAVAAAPLLLPEKVHTRAETIREYQYDSSANQRLGAWGAAFNIAKDRPLTGAGFEFEGVGDNRWITYVPEEYRPFFHTPSSAAHSIYFQVMGQHGFVAFLLFMALLVVVQINLMRVRRAARGRSETRWIATYATGLQIGLIGYLISGAFLSSAYFDLPWLYYALTAILARELKAPVAVEAPNPTFSPVASTGSVRT